MKFLLHLLLRICFRFEVYNQGALATPGPVLLLPNHASWLDWLFLGVVLDDDWKFVTSSTTAEASWIHRKLMTGPRTFPVDTNSPYAAKRMADFLGKGGRLVLFPEGRITTTGSLMKLFDGTGFLLNKTHSKVITCYLRNAVRVHWVRHKGWTQWFPHVSVHFGEPLSPPPMKDVSNTVARERLTSWLQIRMASQQFEVEMEHGAPTVMSAIAEMAGKLPRKVVMEDATQQSLTYRRLMVGTDLLAQAFGKSFAVRDSSNGDQGGRVGVLLPNVNAMPITLLALWSMGRVPAILNFSTGVPTMLVCAQLAGLREILTSRVFLEKARLDISLMEKAGIRFLYLEDIRAGIGGFAKFAALMRHTWNCGGAFRTSDSSASLRERSGDTAVILFTSGSEGVPKGVELTHRNLLANVRQVAAHYDISDDERFFNALPLFHSFGLTACTVFPLVRGLYVFMYPSPLHYRMVPAAVYDRDCTVMVGTNTFLNGYARRAHPYDFRSVKFMVVGAEKVQEATANTYARKFGVRLLEGYGATECSPAVCLNSRIAPRFGSVGRFIPGIEWKLEPVEGVAEGGRLFVRGPNIMKGYLNPEANEKFLALGGWYDTGDLARVDDDGFVFLLGRMKRFAKVSGEMVSLTAVEDAFAGAFPEIGLRCEVAVIAVPDEGKGEKLIAVTNQEKLTLEALRNVIKAKGMTNLCAPREIRYLHEIPKLGTGKVNHRGVLEWYQAQPAAAA